MSEATSLPNEKRVDNYIRQNANGHGKNALSNRQLRRLERHDKKQAANLKKINLVKAASFKTDEPTAVPPTLEITPLSEEQNKEVLAALEDVNECPRCGATGDEPCMTPSNKPAAKPHSGRAA